MFESLADRIHGGIMSLHITRLSISLIAAVSLTACSSVAGTGGASVSPSAEQPGAGINEPIEASLPSAPEPSPAAGFDEQSGPDEDLCESLNFSDFEPFVPSREGFIMSHHKDVLECTSDYQSDYMESVRAKRDDLREESSTRAIYLNVVAIDEVIPNFPGYREAVGAKSGQQIFVQDDFPYGRPGLVQAHAFIDDDWFLTLEVNSVLEQPPAGDELFNMAVDSMDTILFDELGNGVLRDAVNTPVEKPGSREEPENEAEETVSTGLKGMLDGDHITAADYFDGSYLGGLAEGWHVKMFEELSVLGEGECEFAITESGESEFGSWSVITDVSRCPALYEDYFHEGEVQEHAFVAWAVRKFPDMGDNYAVWARGDAAATVSDAVLALEIWTSDKLPLGWTSSGQSATEPVD